MKCGIALIILYSVGRSAGGQWQLCSTAVNVTDCCSTDFHTLLCASGCPDRYVTSVTNCNGGQDGSTQTTVTPSTHLPYCCVLDDTQEDHDVAGTLAGGLLGGVALGILLAAGAYFLWRCHLKNRVRTRGTGSGCKSRRQTSSVLPVLPSKLIDPSPVFSPKWQTSQKVTSTGATVQGQQSDVYLTVPPESVESLKDVTIQAAVSTDIDEVYEKFKLSEEEYVASPVAEYNTLTNYIFQQPVIVTLPHFLPQSFSPECVRVYQFSRDLYGKLELVQLKMADSHIEQDSVNVNRHVSSGVFAFDETGQLHIFTNHFTGFFCTYCKHDHPLPTIHLDLHGKLETSDDGTVVVDLRLDACDGRFLIKDFQKDRPDRQAANYDSMVRIDCKVLAPPPEETDPNDVLVGASLELKQAKDEEIWMHSQRKNGQPLYPPDNAIDPKRLCPQRGRTLPERIDWQLTTRQGVTPGPTFQCVIEAGYTARTTQSFQFLVNCRTVVFHARLQLRQPFLRTSTAEGQRSQLYERQDSRRPNSQQNRTSDVRRHTYRWQPPIRDEPETHRKESFTSSARSSARSCSSGVQDLTGEDSSLESEGPGSQLVSRADSRISSGSQGSTVISFGHVNHVSLSVQDTVSHENTPSPDSVDVEEASASGSPCSDQNLSVPIQVLSNEEEMNSQEVP